MAAIWPLATASPRAKPCGHCRHSPGPSLARLLLHVAGMRSPHRLIVVRRGETAIYQAIQQNLDRWPEGTRVIWDRRERDRRTVLRPVTTERRQSERRIPPESMWYTHGFIVAEAHSPADPVADAG